MNSKINQRIDMLKLQLEKVLSQKPEKMKDAVERYQKLLKTSGVHHGVYVISDSATEETLYIGRTKEAKNGIAQRLYNHFGPEALKTYKEPREVVENYSVRVFEEQDKVNRRNFEGFAIAVLLPKHNID